MYITRVKKKSKRSYVDVESTFVDSYSSDQQGQGLHPTFQNRYEVVDRHYCATDVKISVATNRRLFESAIDSLKIAMLWVFRGSGFEKRCRAMGSITVDDIMGQLHRSQDHV